MDHFVKLEKLPGGLEFPPAMRDRIHFDAARRRLVFRGYMSKADFDRLCQISNDWSFRRSLEELFRLAIPEDVTRPRKLARLLGGMTRLFSSR